MGLFVFDIGEIKATTWISPNGHEDSPTWSNEANTHDDQPCCDPPVWPMTYAVSKPLGEILPGTCRTDWIVVTLSAPIEADRMRFYPGVGMSAEPNDPGQMWTEVEIDAYNTNTSSWEDVCGLGSGQSGIFYSSVWTEKAFPGGTITTNKLRLRFVSLSIYCGSSWLQAYLYEVDFGQAPAQACGLCIPAACGFIAVKPEIEQKFAYVLDNNQAGQIFLASVYQEKKLITETKHDLGVTEFLFMKIKSIFTKIKAILGLIVNMAWHPLFRFI